MIERKYLNEKVKVKAPHQPKCQYVQDHSRFRFSKSLFVSDGGVGVQFRSEFFICLLKADSLNYF